MGYYMSKMEGNVRIGDITEAMLRRETISSLKLLRRMINASIRWKEHHEEVDC